jgi:hypothetical protein
MALTASEYKRRYLASEEAILAREQLQGMMADPRYNTSSSYSVHQADGITFVDKHLAYLSEHPKLNAREYLSNLRLMTKIK